jgi:CDP-diglyceride synthetase
MKTNKRKSFLTGMPSWGLALLTMFLAFVVLMVVGDILTAIFKIPESDIGDLVFYILYNLIIAGGCFYICWQNPKSVWYVPVLCNIIGIISAIIEPNFWISSLWIVICGGWLLSIVASIIGARMGKRKAISDIPQT